MRISDWSSDVCSSDLRDGDLGLQLAGAQQADAVGLARAQAGLGQRRLVDRLGRVKLALLDHGLQATDIDRLVDGRERHVEAALRQPAVDRGLAAFEAVDADAGTGLLTLDAAARGLALAGADATTDAHAVLAGARIVGEIGRAHV